MSIEGNMNVKKVNYKIPRIKKQPPSIEENFDDNLYIWSMFQHNFY